MTHRYSPLCVCSRCEVQDAVYRGYAVCVVTVLAVLTLLVVASGLVEFQR